MRVAACVCIRIGIVVALVVAGGLVGDGVVVVSVVDVSVLVVVFF